MDLSPLWTTLYVLAGILGSYIAFVALLTIPACQNQVIYLNAVTLTWFKNVSIPEQWGFLHNQVTPFTLKTPDGETLHAWHILPLGLYEQHEQELVKEPEGIAPDITNRLSFQLLRDDPEALLVLYFHGAAGTLASGFRPPCYRAISASSPYKIHVVAIDYRGFGSSSGAPSEAGLLTDALTLASWAADTAGMPPSRIVLFGQSLGTGVAISLAHHLALRPTEPIFFRGMVLVAPFADVELLTATYRVAGTIPLLSPVARFPRLLALLNRFIKSKWRSREKLAALIRTAEEERGGAGRRYHVDIMHAEDDYDIPWSHSEHLYHAAVDAARAGGGGVSFEELDREKGATRRALGAGGWVACHETARGVVREHILKHGLHDVIMSFPVIGLAIARAFRGA